MDITYELLRATKGFMQGRSEDFWRIFELSIDDMYFQMQFIICDEEQISYHLEKLYTYFIQNAFMLDAPEQVAEWMNETVLQRTSDWLRKNRQDMLQAEAQGAYAVPMVADMFIPGNDMEDAEYTRTLENYLCTLPEIHRMTALGFYYSRLPIDKIEEATLLDASVIKNRTGFIERTLSGQMQEYCKERGCRMKPITSQRLLTALCELQKLYRYPHAEELYNTLRIKVIH